jgi:hypothetical protein
MFRAVRASNSTLIEGGLFERTVALADLSESDFYLIDICRVTGGKDHTKFFHSHFGSITPHGLALQPTNGIAANQTCMRNFASDARPAPGWSVDWKIEDRYRLLPPSSDIGLRYTDLTSEAEAYTCEAWVVSGIFDSTEETWIPRVLTRRRGKSAPLVSTFVSVIEPYDKKPRIANVKRIKLDSDCDVAMELELTDGRRDLFIAVDPARAPGIIEVPSWNLRLDGELFWARRAANRKLQHVFLSHGNFANLGEFTLRKQMEREFEEWP